MERFGFLLFPASSPDLYRKLSLLGLMKMNSLHCWQSFAWLTQFNKCLLSSSLMERTTLCIVFFFFSMSLQSRNGGRQEITQAIIIQGGIISTSHEMQINLRGGLSVQFSHSVVSDSLRTHGLQQTRLPCPSPAPRAYSNSCPSRQWWKPAISSSDILFPSRLQSFSASGSFPRSQLFTSGGQSIGVSVLPMNIQDWFALGWTDFISLQSKGLGLEQESSSTPQF